MRKLLFYLQISILAFVPLSCYKPKVTPTQKSTESNRSGISYVFVITADKGVVKSDENPSTGTLSLSLGNDFVFFFSGNPRHLAGKMTIQEFLKNWGQGANSFAEDHPNAILVGNKIPSNTPLEVPIILSKPTYDPNGNQLTFKITTIGSATLESQELVDTMLFVDDWNGDLGGSI